MFEAAGSRAEVERSACEYAVKEVTSKFWVCLEERAKVLDVVVVEVRRPRRKNTLEMLGIIGKRRMQSDTHQKQSRQSE
jgi:hypothetical protein